MTRAMRAIREHEGKRLTNLWHECMRDALFAELQQPRVIYVLLRHL
jgi:hypothetical protein